MALKILNSKIESKTHKSLSRLQKLICKLFKITPEVSCLFNLLITVDSSGPLQFAHYIEAEDGTMWRVIKKVNDNTFLLAALDYLPFSYKGIYGSFIILGSAYSETSGRE